MVPLDGRGDGGRGGVHLHGLHRHEADLGLGLERLVPHHGGGAGHGGHPAPRLAPLPPPAPAHGRESRQPLAAHLLLVGITHIALRGDEQVFVSIWKHINDY